MTEVKPVAVEVDDLLRMVRGRYGKGAQTPQEATCDTPDPAGQKTGLELQNAQLRKAVRDAEEALGKYLELYNRSPASYLTLDRKGTIHDANLTFAVLAGVSRTGLIGAQFGSFLTEASRGTFAALLAREFAGPGRANCQVTLRNGAAATPLLVQVGAATSGDRWLIALVEISLQ